MRLDRPIVLVLVAAAVLLVACGDTRSPRQRYLDELRLGGIPVDEVGSAEVCAMRPGGVEAKLASAGVAEADRRARIVVFAARHVCDQSGA
ncbi:MAG: hypothetical protein GEU98_26055 [Pseudonocardiaceae bacterium]|nr:hypothetical protein [Pseudonocardiaceae bacterium]